ncbi:S46 family peptidase [soil metagenome]
MRLFLRVFPLAALLVPALAAADEGMWPYDMVPKDKILKDHGTAVTYAQLDHLRLATVRLSSGGTGSFVSGHGFILTNHHVASDCIAKIASAQHNYMDEGYLAGRDGGEARCPDLTADVLSAMSDVTPRVRMARKDGMSDADANTAMKAEMGKIEKECSDKGTPAPHCEVVTLYAGGKYVLYTYKRYTDLRLVFAPEAPIAFFGGDPDNFTYPRYDLDMAIFRAYEGNAPATPQSFLKWNEGGAKDGETVFVSGNPGNTGRLQPVAQLERLRDTVYPYVLAALARERDLLKGVSLQGKEYDREAREPIFGVENGIKALTGYLGGLKDPALMRKKQTEEAALQKGIDADPKLKASYGTVFVDVKKAQDRLGALYIKYSVLERLGYSSLMSFARTLVLLADEKPLASDKRLREYRDSNMEEVERGLLSSAPVYGAVEVALVRAWIEQAQRTLTADQLKLVLKGETPERAAQRMVSESKLFDVYARRKLLAGGKEAIAASDDPFIVLLRALDGDARATRKQYEDDVEAPMRKLGEQIAQVTFAVRGSAMPPDATFTLRLSVGIVKGYTEKGKPIPFATDFAGMYAHATGADPYKLPPAWLAKKDTLKKDTKLNFVSTNDIIGGNSGSPVVDAQGEIVGLIFDGNISSLPNRFVYREETERAVSVDTAGMTEALLKIYGADAVVKELRGN